MEQPMTPTMPAPASAQPQKPSRPPRRLRATEFAGDPLRSLEELAASQGDIAQIRFGRRRAYVFSHPDLVKDLLVTNSRLFIKGEGLQRAKRLLGNGLLTSEGEFHLRQRRLLQPVFLKSRIRDYADTMGRHSVGTARHWEDGAEVNMADEMNRLTLGVVGETLFSTNVGDKADEIGASLDTALEMFQTLGSPFIAILERLPFGPMARFRKASARLDDIVIKLIEERRASGEDRGDLLSLLLAARYDDGSAMDNTQLRDEALTILLAGHETTSNALSWTWVELSRHLEVARRLHEEAVAVMGDDPPRFEHVDKLCYTRQVISESMRLHPPAWIIGRIALDDYMVEHEGERHVIPRGSIVVVSQWVIHRDSRYWPNPMEFNPDRWENPDPNLPKFAYFPFGAGPRQCIGEGFAWMEAILLLAGLARNWKATLIGEAPPPQPRITLRPGGPIRMKLEAWC